MRWFGNGGLCLGGSNSYTRAGCFVKAINKVICTIQRIIVVYLWVSLLLVIFDIASIVY